MDFKVLNKLSYGMYVIGTKVDDRNVGCFVNTATQVTSQNPMITVCINKNNYTNEALRKTKYFSVSILSEKTNPLVIGTFGFFSSKDKNKFEEFDYEEIDIIEKIDKEVEFKQMAFEQDKVSKTLPVLKENTCGSLICEVVQIVDAETHDIFMARVIETKRGEEDLVPMAYRFYHEVIKGTAPKTAPTYTEENKVENKANDKIEIGENREELTKKDNVIENQNEIKLESKGEEKMENQEFKKYQCTICGYIYDDSKEEVKFVDLPDDWKCPKCKVGKNLFKEI